MLEIDGSIKSASFRMKMKIVPGFGCEHIRSQNQEMTRYALKIQGGFHPIPATSGSHVGQMPVFLKAESGIMVEIKESVRYFTMPHCFCGSEWVGLFLCVPIPTVLTTCFALLHQCSSDVTV
jgi:hypothetical protein